MRVTRESNAQLVVSFAYDPALVGWIKSNCEGRRYQPQIRAWRVFNSPKNRAELYKRGFVFDGNFPENENPSNGAPKTQAEIKPVEIEGFKANLREYQKIGVAFANEKNGRCLIADEMGLGKTIQAIAWVFQNRKQAGTVLVICPASLRENWRREFQKHAGMQTNVVNGGGVSVPAGEVTIINYDRLKNLPKGLRVDTLILDEAHYVKNPSANRSKLTAELSRKARHVIALTGTPITARPMDLWHAVKCINPGLFPSRHSFGIRYCAGRNNGWGWEYKGASHTDELHQILAENIMIRRKKSEVLSELPDKQRIVVNFKIDNRVEYDNARKNLIAWLLLNKSKQAAERASRAEQLARFQHLKMLAAQGKIAQAIEWLENFLEETDEKVVVFTTHKAIADAVYDHFEKTAVKLTGDCNMNQRQDAVDRFQNDDSVRVFVGNMTAAGVGITLTAARTVVFLELGWNPSEHNQAEDRIHRIGQEKECTAYYLIAGDTIEEELMELIDSKRKNIDSIIDNLQTEDDDLLGKLFEKYGA